MEPMGILGTHWQLQIASTLRGDILKNKGLKRLVNAYTSLGTPYCIYSVRYPETLFKLLRPLHYRFFLKPENPPAGSEPKNPRP